MVQIPDYRVELTGFDSPEIADLRASLVPPSNVGEEEDFDLEAALARMATPITKAGDLIQLGRHHLLCGDSSDLAQVKHLLNGQPIHLVVTDPPYGVRLESRSGRAQAVRNGSHGQPVRLRAKDRRLANDFLSPEEFESKLRAWFANIAEVLLPGRAYVAWGG